MSVGCAFLSGYILSCDIPSPLRRYFKSFMDEVIIIPSTGAATGTLDGSNSAEQEQSGDMEQVPTEHTSGDETEHHHDDVPDMGSISGSQQSVYFTQLLLILLETMLRSFPMFICGQNLVDITRWLDDLIPWAIAESPVVAMNTLVNLLSGSHRENYRTVVVSTLRALSLATSQGNCKWFGTRQDCVKALGAALVSKQWEYSSKRTALAKLIILSALSSAESSAASSALSIKIGEEENLGNSDVKSVSEVAHKLLENVIVQSDLFIGHGAADIELLAEKNSWLHVVTSSLTSGTNDYDSSDWRGNIVLLFELFLRISHHWNVEACLGAHSVLCTLHQDHEGISLDRDTNDYVKSNIVPFSPILYCSLAVSCGNLSMMQSQLPNHIQMRYDVLSTSTASSATTEQNESLAFFEKFCWGFRKEVEFMLTQVVLHSLPWYTSPTSFLDVLSATTKHLDTIPALSGCSVGEVVSAMTLLYRQQSEGGVQRTKAKRPRTRSNSMTDFQPLSLADLAASASVDFSRSPSAKPGLALVVAIATAQLEGNFEFHQHTAGQEEISQYWALLFESALVLSPPSGITMTVLASVEALLLRESMGITTRSFEHKIAITVYAVRVMRVLGRYLVTTPPSKIVTARPTRSCKRLQQPDTTTDEVHMGSEARTKIENVLNVLTMLVVESVRTTGCATQIATALNVPHVSDTFVDNSPLGRSYLRILFAAVLAQYRQMQSHPRKKHEIQHNMDALWRNVCNKLRSIDFASALEGDKGLFGLCWAIQMVHDDTQMRRAFVSYALQEKHVEGSTRDSAGGISGGGFQLTSLAQAEEYKLSGEHSTGLSSWALSPIHSSVLNAGDPAALCQALSGLYSTYAAALSRGDVATARGTIINAFCGVVVQTEHSNTLSMTEVALSVPCYYCETLSLVDLPGLCSSMDQWAFFASLSSSVESSLLCNPSALASFQEYAIIFNKCPAFLAINELTLDQICEQLVVPWKKGSTTDMFLTTISNILKARLTEVCEKSNGMTPSMRDLIKLYADILTDTLTSTSVLINVTSVLQASLCNGVVDLVAVLLPCVMSIASMHITHNGLSALAWLDMYEKTLQVLVDGMGSVMKAAYSAKNDTKSNRSALTKFVTATQFVLSLRIPTATITKERLLSSCAKCAAMINKVIKSCLKYALGDSMALQMLEYILHSSVESHSHSDPSSNVFDMMSQDEEVGYSDVFQLCQAAVATEHQASSSEVYETFSFPMILEMIVSHSQFEVTLSENEYLLKFILYLLGLVFTGVKEEAPCDVPGECISFMAQCVMRSYGGSMSVPDRIAMRILYISELLQIMIENANSASNQGDSKVPRRSILTYPPKLAVHKDASWILTALTPPGVYSTLATFPTWRTLKPQPIEFEYKSLLSEHMDTVRSDREMMLEYLEARAHHEEEIASTQKPNKGLRKVCSPEGTDGIDQNDEDDDDTAHSHTDSSTHAVDFLHDGNNGVLDPSYWLPCIYMSLSQCSDLSMRQFANCGALALVIASLTSECPIVRSYAKASLHLVLELLRRQTPDKDSAFRERPQLLVIVNFIRNAFDSGTNKTRAVEDHLPLTSGIFLGRAALHLLQPQHTLYSSINKYLLSRPYCDVKDIPLYDSLIAEGDVENDAATRLAALRFLRDCVGSKEDHLNMCRKNAYSRLMVYFVLFGRDAKCAHAILDIFERALSFSAGARYLLERCALIPWLQQLASPLNSSHISLHTEGMQPSTVGTSSGMSGDARERSEGGDDMPLQAAPPRLLFRVIALLRKTISALSLLEGEGVAVFTHLQHAYIATTATIREILTIHDLSSQHLNDSILPHEYFRQVTLCMWDITLASSAINAGDFCTMGLHWRASDIVALGKICLLLYKHSNGGSGQNRVDSEKLALSLLSLLAFQKDGSADGLLCIDEMQTALSLVIGASTLQLFTSLHGGKKPPEEQTLCLLRTPRNGVCVDSKSHHHDDHDTKVLPATTEFFKVYCNGMHIVFQDWSSRSVTTAGATASTTTSSCGYNFIQASSQQALFSPDECFAHIVQNNWTVLSSMHFTSTPLPIDLGYKFVLKICLKAVLNILGSACPMTSCDSDSKSSLALQVMRWALLMKRCHVDTVLSPDWSSTNDANRSSHFTTATTIASRIIGVFDTVNKRDCDSSFVHYSCLYDTALVAAYSCVLHLSVMLNGSVEDRMESSRIKLGQHLKLVLLRVIHVLCTNIIDPLSSIPEYNASYDKTSESFRTKASRKLQLYRLCQGDDNESGRALSLSLIEACCGAVSTVVTLHDRLHSVSEHDTSYADILTTEIDVADGHRHEDRSGNVAVANLLSKCVTLDNLVEMIRACDSDMSASSMLVNHSTAGLFDPQNIWSESHYVTKGERTFGAYALYENMDYGSSSRVCSVGGLTHRPKKGRHRSGLDMLHSAMRDAAKESSALGDVLPDEDTQRITMAMEDGGEEFGDHELVDNTLGQDMSGAMEDGGELFRRDLRVKIVRKRPRFHKLTFTPHFSRKRKAKFVTQDAI